jgi:uncharacterized DUF497 family protein
VDKIATEHGVTQTEVREILMGVHKLKFVQKGHYPGEDMYAALGQTDAGRYLVVFFIYKKDKRALVLSARDMSSAERKRYAKG